MTPELTRLFPALAGLSEALVREVKRQGVNLEVPAGTLLFDAGMSCQALPLVNVRLGRERIEVLAPAALRQKAAGT